MPVEIDSIKPRPGCSKPLDPAWIAGACPAVQGAGEVDRAGEAEAGQDQPRLPRERGLALVRRQNFWVRTEEERTAKANQSVKMN